MDKEKMKNDIGKVINEAQEKIDDLKDEMDERLDEAKEKMLYARKTAKGYIKDNPEKAVLIAAGVGTVIGILLSVMRRRRY